MTEEAIEDDHELSVALRRARLLGRRLAVPMDVSPGEGFRDLMFRAAAENGHQTMATLARMVGLRGHAVLGRYATVADTLDPARAADILGTPLGQSDIQPLLYPRGRPGSNNLMFFGREIRRSSLSRLTRRVSPSSIKKSLHQKAIWSVRALNFDPQTRDVLVDRCPRCNNPLDFNFTWGVERCGNAFDLKGGHGECVSVDLRDAEIVKAEADDEEALQFVTNLIDPEVSVSTAASDAPQILAGYGPGQIFELIFTLARMYVEVMTQDTVPTKRGSGYRFRQVSASELSTAARAVLGWPEKYHEYAETLRIGHISNLQASGKSGHWHPLKKINPAFDDRLRVLLVSEAENARQMSFLLDAQAAKSAKASRTVIAPRVDRMVDESKLTGKLNIVRRNIAGKLRSKTETARFDPTTPHLIDEVFVLRDSPAAKNFSISAGIVIPFIPDLYRHNIVEVLDPTLEAAFYAGREPPQLNLGKRLRDVSQKSPLPTSAVSLLQACAVLTTRPINPWPVVLKAICSRSLDIWVTGTVSERLLKQTFVTDYSQIAGLLAGAEKADGIETVRLTTEELGLVIGVSKAYVYRLYEGGLLSRAPTLADAWRFHESYITTNEVMLRARLLGARRTRGSYGTELNAAGIHSFPLIHAVSARERTKVEAHFGDRLAPRT